MADALASAVDSARSFVINSPGYAALLTFFGVIPVIVVLNVVRQLLPRDPSLPPEVFHIVPIIGSTVQYGRDPLNFLFRCKEKYGNVFTFVLLGRKVTVALGSKGNNFVLDGKHSSFSAEDAYKHFTVPAFGKGVVYDVPNEAFMEQKKFVRVGLTPNLFRTYVDMIEDEVLCMLKTDANFLSYQKNDLKKWGRFDAQQIMEKITILTTSRTLQGPEVRENVNKSFAKLFRGLDGGFQPINFLLPNLPLESYRKRDDAQKKMSEFYSNIIRNRKQSGIDAQDMIAVLMSQKYRDGSPLPDHVVAHLMIALHLAGHHTTSSGGSWGLLHLAQNTKVQEALYQEQIKHFGNDDGTFRNMTYDELRELPVMNAVIRETLRLHPPVPYVMRYVLADTPVPPSLAAPSKDGTYVVPRGHYVLACTGVTQVDPEVWHDPYTWDPARWSDPDGVAVQAFQAYAGDNSEKVDYGFGMINKGTDSPYAPFGAGRHRCVGEQFAYLQLGVVFATLIRHIELKMDQPLPRPDYYSVTPHPLKPSNICYRRRALDT